MTLKPMSKERKMKIMILGDSMTQGQEGEHTWRYRLWHWLRESKHYDDPVIHFVGPYAGTQEHGKARPPQPPRFDGETDPDEGPKVSGSYAEDCHHAWAHDSFHCSLWGRQVAHAYPEIEQQVLDYSPDYLLVALGVNDIIWKVSDAQGTLDSMRNLVDNARKAKSDIRLILSTVPHKISDDEDEAFVETEAYNDLIKEASAEWSTEASPIVLADVAGNYSCGIGGCAAGYDGLHPNTRGEYEMAKAFSEAMVDFGLRAAPLIMPFDVSDPVPPIPVDVLAASSPIGAVITWSAVFAARWYEARTRQEGDESWDGPHAALAPRHDITFTAPDVLWQAQVRACMSHDEGDKSGWSATVSAKSTRSTAPGPSDIGVTALDGGVQITWKSPGGDWDVDRYEVCIHDTDDPEAIFPNVTAARRSPFAHRDLQAGHRYNIWMATWAFVDGVLYKGLPKGANPFCADAGTPEAPTDLEAAKRDDSTVHLKWSRSARSAGYRVYTRSRADGDGQQWRSCKEDVQRETELDVAGLDGVDELEFSVAGVSGDLESGKSDVAIPCV